MSVFVLTKRYFIRCNVNFPFFSVNIFFLSGSFFMNICCNSRDSRGRWEEGCISLTPFFHVHPIHRHLDVSWVVIAVSSPLHIDNSRNRSRNLWFLSSFFLLWFYRCQLIYSSGGGHLQILIIVLLFQDAQFL